MNLKNKWNKRWNPRFIGLDKIRTLILYTFLGQFFHRPTFYQSRAMYIDTGSYHTDGCQHSLFKRHSNEETIDLSYFHNPKFQIWVRLESTMPTNDIEHRTGRKKGCQCFVYTAQNSLQIYLDVEGGANYYVLVIASRIACQALVNNLMAVPSNQFHSQYSD